MEAKKIYLIDSANNNKVVNYFFDESEVDVYLKNIYAEKSTDQELEEYLDDFFTVTEEEMKEAVKKYGPRRKEYWT